MKQVDKIISILQQDIELPDIVARKADEAFNQILNQNEKECVQMNRQDQQGRQSRKRPLRWKKGMAAVAAVLVLVVGGCMAKPELAAKIFDMLQGKVSYSGDYSNYAVPLESETGETGESDNSEALAFTKTADGVKVTLLEVYCNQEALNISMLIEGKENFREIIMVDQFGKQNLTLSMEAIFSFQPKPHVSYGYLEGEFLDERTFAGIWRLDLKDVLTDDTKIDSMVKEAEAEGREFIITEEVVKEYSRPISLPEQFTVKMNLKKIIGELADQQNVDWGMSTGELEALSDEEFNQLYLEVTGRYGIDEYPNAAQNYWLDGPWEFTIPVEVNHSDNRTVSVNDTNDKGIGLESVTITPFEMQLNLIFENNNGADYYPVVLDAEGNRMASAGNALSLPVDGHDVSRIYVYLCDYLSYMDELKGYQDENDFKRLLEEQSEYSVEVNLQ